MCIIEHQLYSWDDGIITTSMKDTWHLFLIVNFVYQDDSLKCDAESLSGAAPDICIAYKLHLECGRLINLVDWLEVGKMIQCIPAILLDFF